MDIKIKNILTGNCLKYTETFIPMILLVIISFGQSQAQWQITSLPGNAAVNTIVIKDSYIFAGTNGDGIFVSTDNGENWDSINVGMQSKTVHAFLANGNTVFAGTEAGVSISTDNGKSWNSINSGLSGLGVWSLGVNSDISGDTTIFAGTWSGVYSTTDKGKNWKATGLSNTSVPVHSIIVHKNYIFAATLTNGIFVSVDNGLTWKNIILPLSDKSYEPGFTVPVCSISKLISSTSTYIVAGSWYGDLYYMDYKASVFQVAIIIYKQAVPLLCLAGRNDTLFAANSSGYFFVADQNQIWHRSSFPPLGAGAVYSMAFNHSYIFAATGKGIWRLWYPDQVTNTNSSEDRPSGFVLDQNYPNPFNPSTIINFELPAESFVTLKIFDPLGREVTTLVSQEMSAGKYTRQWDADGYTGGVYFYRMTAGDRSIVKKMILIK